LTAGIGRSGFGQERQKHLGHLVEYFLGEVVSGVGDVNGDAVGLPRAKRPGKDEGSARQRGRRWAGAAVAAGVGRPGR
jgi:hypothetical protein